LAKNTNQLRQYIILSKKLGSVFLFICLFSQPTFTFAEFRAGIGVRIVTPDPLLPVSGGVGPPKMSQEKKVILQLGQWYSRMAIKEWHL